MSQLVIINPYHKSVKIDTETVIEEVLPFPDYLNHLASVSCTYTSETKAIENVNSVHRYVSHFIEKEYYYKHLPAFITWFYAEKAAQKIKKETDYNNLVTLIDEYISPLLEELETKITNTEVTSIYYNKLLKTINLIKGSTLTTLTTIINEATENFSGLMTANDVKALRELQTKVESLTSLGVWRKTYKTYAALIAEYPALNVTNTLWEVNDYVYVDRDENYNPTTPVRTSYAVVKVGTSKFLQFRRTEQDGISQASNTSLGVVKGTSTRKGGIYVETNGEMSLNGWDDVTAHITTLFLTEGELMAYENPVGSGKYPTLINKTVVVLDPV